MLKRVRFPYLLINCLFISEDIIGFTTDKL